MFQLETANIRFDHLVIFSKGCWGQKSPKVIQGHLGSLSVKNKIVAIPHILLNYNKTYNKCPKMGSKCQIFVSLRTTITIFSDLKRIMMVKEIPRNGVIWFIEIAPNNLQIFKM